MKQGLSSVVFVSVVAFVGLAVAPWAQAPPGSQALRSPEAFRTGINTVQVAVTVTDRDGRLITGLKAEDFEVFDEGDPQPITQFTDARLPVSLGVMLDASDSMRGQPIVDARAAVDRFLATLLQPEDEAFVGAFNHAPRIVSAWTRPPIELRSRLDGERPTGGTAIYDALFEAAPLFGRRQHARAALILISDGADTASDHSLNESRDALRRSDAFLYAIAIDSEVDRRESTRVSPGALQQLTGPTGGYTEVVRSAADVAPATERIARELDSQYTLGYSMPPPPDGRWRSIRVRVKTPGYFARSRRGYYASARAR